MSIIYNEKQLENKQIIYCQKTEKHVIMNLNKRGV